MPQVPAQPCRPAAHRWAPFTCLQPEGVRAGHEEGRRRFLHVLNPNAAPSTSTPAYPAGSSPHRLSQTSDPRCQHILELPSPGDSAGLARWQEMKLHLLRAHSQKVPMRWDSKSLYHHPGVWCWPQPARGRAMPPGCLCPLLQPPGGCGTELLPPPHPGERRAGLYLVISTTSSRNAPAESRFIFSSSEAEQVLPLVCDSPALITRCSPTREHGPKPPLLMARRAPGPGQSHRAASRGMEATAPICRGCCFPPHFTVPPPCSAPAHATTSPQASREWAHGGCNGDQWPRQPATDFPRSSLSAFVKGRVKRYWFLTISLL